MEKREVKFMAVLQTGSRHLLYTILGEYEFDDNSKNFVKSVESMLSVYADYNI